MICEKCKKEIDDSSKTPEEAMRKYTAKLKEHNKKLREKNDTPK